MSDETDQDATPPAPSPDNLQDILHKVVIAHQQALTLLQQTEAAYARLVPHQLLRLLNAKSIVDVKLGDQVERKMSIMFADIRDFTPLSESMTPAENFEFINSYLSQMEPAISKHRGIIDKYIGDAILALFVHGADDALNGAIAMLDRLEYYNQGRQRAGYHPIRVGIGLNSGMVMLGTVGGNTRMDSTVIGDAVNLTARLEAITKLYHTPLLISHHTLYDLNDPGQYDIRFLDRIRVKGKSQPLSIYEVFNNDEPDLRAAKRKTLTLFEQAVSYYHLKQIDRAIRLFKDCLAIDPRDFPALIYLERCHEYLSSGQHQGTGELQSGLIWDDSHISGLPDLDSQHHALLDHINHIRSRIAQDQCTDCADTFDFLNRYTQNVFPIEEKLMREHEYPYLDSHLLEHSHFTSHLASLALQAQQPSDEPIYLAFRLYLLLLDWYAAHISKSDRHFSRHLFKSAS